MFFEVGVGHPRDHFSVVMCSLPESGTNFGKKYSEDDTYYALVTCMGEPVINRTMPVLKSTNLEIARRQFHMRLVLMVQEESRRSGILPKDVLLRVDKNTGPKEIQNLLWRELKNIDFGVECI